MRIRPDFATSRHALRALSTALAGGASIALLMGSAMAATAKPKDTAAAADTPPAVACLATATLATDADVVVHSTNPAIDGQVSSGNTPPITIDSPTVFYVAAASGSQAIRYVYALARGSQIIASSDKPLSITHSQMKVQHRSDTGPGLRSGPVTLWVWGVDQINQISAPLKISLNVAGQD